MSATTYATAKQKVLEDMDYEDEEIVQPTELKAYFNDALRTVKQETVTMYQDYFTVKAFLALTNGISEYDLPSDIYVQKIKKIIYDNGSDIIYEIPQFVGPTRFLQRAYLRNTNILDFYQYTLFNYTTGLKLELTPISRETSAQNVTIFYDREMTFITSDASYVDKEIPGCLSYVYAIVKAKCKQKEEGGMMPPDAAAEVKYERDLFVDTLGVRVEDDNTEVVKDFTYYYESS